MRFCPLVSQRIRVPPSKTSTYSPDFRLTYCGRTVYVLSNLGRLYVVCKGFKPLRCSNASLPFELEKKYVFEVSSYEECISLWLDLSKELLRRIDV